jgi:hypothetical protein
MEAIQKEVGAAGAYMEPRPLSETRLSSALQRCYILFF